MGLYTMIAAGTVPVTALLAGVLASWLGPEGAILISAVVMVALLTWVLAAHKLRLVKFDLAAQDSDDPSMGGSYTIDPSIDATSDGHSVAGQSAVGHGVVGETAERYRAAEPERPATRSES